jgi:uncharacterized SAM-binding protein YcdF (DUF218 family)/lysophospholipase L1-like esterase
MTFGVIPFFSRQISGSRHPSSRRRTFFAGVLCGVLLFGGGRAVINETRAADVLVGPLQLPDTDGQSDAIVIAGAGLIGDCLLNVHGVRRVLLASRLWHEHRAPIMVFTGGRPDDMPCAVSKVMSDLARDLGVSTRSIHVETTSRSTRENAEHSLPVLRALGARRLLLVTDRLHMRRTELAFRHFGFDVERASVPVPASHPDNVSMLFAGIREYAGLSYYRARGWLTSPAAGDRAPSVSQGVLMPMSGNDPQVVVLGASYAGGWELPGAGRLTVVNKGVPGQQSFELLDRFDRDVVALKPRAVILWGFINDIFRSDRSKIQTTLARARESFETMIRRARASGIEPILTTEVTIRPASSWLEMLAGWIGAARGKESYHDWINKHVLETNAWTRELARRENVLLLDLQPVISESSQRRHRRFAHEDGSHITSAGYAALTAYALPMLDRHFAETASTQ